MRGKMALNAGFRLPVAVTPFGSISSRRRARRPHLALQSCGRRGLRPVLLITRFPAIGRAILPLRSKREGAGVRENRSAQNVHILRIMLLLFLWLSAVASAAATVVLNPHGLELARWLVGSVLWLRPQIEEWNPATLDGDHAAFFIYAVFAMVAFVASLIASQHSRANSGKWRCWRFLFLVAFRAVRNTPLFCVAALALVPPHLADVVQRFSAATFGASSNT